jgi:hypothetical protein
MADFIQLANCAIGLAALVFLIRYTVETKKIREAAQEQVEGISKPCLTIWADLRNPADAILEMNDAVGGLVVHGVNSNIVVQNIGTGIALNISYYFKSLEASRTDRPERARYLLYVLQGQKIELPESMNVSAYGGNCEVVFHFRSIGGKHYQSTVTMNNHVLTAFDLKALKA